MILIWCLWNVYNFLQFQRLNKFDLKNSNSDEMDCLEKNFQRHLFLRLNKKGKLKNFWLNNM